MIHLRRIHHVCLPTDDLHAGARRWSTQLGVTGLGVEHAQSADAVHLHDCSGEAHSSTTCGILPPRSPFRLDTAAMQAAREALEALGHPRPAGGSQ